MREKDPCDIRSHLMRIQNGQITFDSLDPHAEYIATYYPNADGHTTFELNLKKCPDEFEQALSLLHECLHEDPRFNEEAVQKRHHILSTELGKASVHRKIHKLLEQEIDNEALRILAKYPKILKWIYSRLRRAKAFEIGKWQERAGEKRVFWFKCYADRVIKMGNILSSNKLLVSTWDKISNKDIKQTICGR